MLEAIARVYWNENLSGFFPGRRGKPIQRLRRTGSPRVQKALADIGATAYQLESELLRAADRHDISFTRTGRNVIYRIDPVRTPILILAGSFLIACRLPGSSRAQGRAGNVTTRTC